MNDAGPSDRAPGTVTGRLAVEAVVIVLSILVAFGIDAWWDERQEARSRQAILVALRSDAAAARIEAERVRSGMVRGLEGTQAFLALAEGPELDARDASRIDRMATTLFLSPSFDAPLGSLLALLEGGDLSYVENPELVERITRLLALVANLEREQLVLATNVARIMEAMNTRGIDTTRLLAKIESDLWTMPVQKRDTELWAHVGDPRLRSLALTSWIRYRICATSLEQMDADFVAIGELVDAQLADAT